MTKQKLIDKLAGLTEPSREADVAIAVFFNYTRKRVSLPRVGLRWFDASGKAVRVLPYFTTDIDAAKALCDAILPDAPGGFSFHDGGAKAVVAGGEHAVAFNPATALCLALVRSRD